MKKDILLHTGICFFIFIIVFLCNKIPEGYIVSGGDFYQLLNINENISRYLFTWFNHSGQGQFNPLATTYPFYLFQQGLFSLGFTYSQITNSILFVFLIGSFYSFYFSQRILFPEKSASIVGSILYTFNLTSFTFITYSWGVTHHVLIYVFIPLLLGIFIRFINTKGIFQNKYTYLSLLIFIFSLPAYNNVAFLFALFFIQGLLLVFTATLPLTYQQFLNRFYKFGFLILSEILLSILILVPFLFSQFSYKDQVLNTKAFAGDAITTIMSNTSSNPLNAFRGIMDNWRFPLTGLETKLQEIPEQFLFFSGIFSLSTILFIIIGTFFLKRDLKQSVGYYYGILSVYLILLFLSFRLTPPFDIVNLSFYKTLTMGLFRSPDKIFMFVPFFSSLLIVLLFQYIKPRKLYVFIFLIIYIASNSFLFFGGILKIFSASNKTEYSQLIKIPDEYLNIKSIIDSDHSSQAILSIPYSVVNSLNWSNYPKWGYIGHDLLHLLYQKRYISANSYDHGSLETKLSLQIFSNTGASLSELTGVIQKFGGRFILNHKDVESQFLGKTENNLLLLEQKGVLNKRSETAYFDLYEVSKKYLTPIISGDNIIFKKYSPVLYGFTIHALRQEYELAFLQSHNPEWKLYLEPYSNLNCTPVATYSGSTTECASKNTFYAGGELSKLWQKPIFDDTHKMVYDYANEWTIDPVYIKANYSKEYYKENPDGSIDVRMTLYFKPQSYFYLGLIISGTTLMGLLGYFGYSWMRRRRGKSSDVGEFEI